MINAWCNLVWYKPHIAAIVVLWPVYFFLGLSVFYCVMEWLENKYLESVKIFTVSIELTLDHGAINDN